MKSKPDPVGQDFLLADLAAVIQGADKINDQLC
jgi:hypothetical protein